MLNLPASAPAGSDRATSSPFGSMAVQVATTLVRCAAWVRVTVRGSWFLLLAIVVLTVYRGGHELPEDIERLSPPLLTHLAMRLLIIRARLVFSPPAHHRLLTNRPVTWRGTLGLSAMDVATSTLCVANHGGFQDFAFLGYCPAPCAFAVVFSSFQFVLA